MSGELVLVTGASGFIAAHIVQQLLTSGYRVRGTVRDLNNRSKTDPLKALCPEAAHSLELVEADLLDAECWKEVVKGCRYVMHVACPWPVEEPKSEDHVIKPAVQGTLHVMQAALDTGTVKRLIMTSAVTAMTNGYNYDPNTTYTEQHMTDPNAKRIGIHGKCKALAEKAAFDFVAKHERALLKQGFTLTVLNPSPVIGPAINNASSYVMQFCKSMLKGDWPMTARIQVMLIDVRDVAKAHLVAMTAAEAANQRYILANNSLWFKELAEMVNKQGYRIPTTEAPYAFFALLCLKDRRLKMIQGAFGKEIKVDNSKMRRDLKIELTPLQQSVSDMIHAMQERRLIDDPRMYKK